MYPSVSVLCLGRITSESCSGFFVLISENLPNQNFLSPVLHVVILVPQKTIFGGTWDGSVFAMACSYYSPGYRLLYISIYSNEIIIFFGMWILYFFKYTTRTNNGTRSVIDSRQFFFISMRIHLTSGWEFIATGPCRSSHIGTGLQVPRGIVLYSATLTLEFLHSDIFHDLVGSVGLIFYPVLLGMSLRESLLALISQCWASSRAVRGSWGCI